MTYSPWKEVACAGVVIKAKDLLSCDGTRFNGFHRRIGESGGIHQFIGYDGPVILSSIMPDRMIAGFSAEAYADMIGTLQPDYFLTPDGETYYNEGERSGREIKRILDETRYLLESNPSVLPIGLVKGCDLHQIESHSDELLQLGLTRFAFHASDFLRRGPAWMGRQAVEFATKIRVKVPWFLVYGVGAVRSFQKFHFADGYITQSHFVNAFYGRLCDGTDDAVRKVTRRDIMNNLRKVQRNMIAVQHQANLSQWLEPNRTSDGLIAGSIVKQTSG
jgi:hypothetical protein